ncbi:MAG: dephospho-CoA kinase [Eubacteriales bacterium]|nr:dephospho-CoA kinase [Eubacteriales bacterium]
MVVIGLTGGIATGKSAASRYLKSLGARVWDADKAARRAVLPGSDGAAAVRAAFGDEFFDEEGNLLRARLGKLIFADEQKRAQLNAIVHPLVTRELQRTLHSWRQQQVAVAVVDAPLLLEAGLEGLVMLAVAP